MTDNHLSLIPLPDVSLALARPEVGRVLSEMVGDTLALALRKPLSKIGEYEWCEPDYRQILLWATHFRAAPRPASHPFQCPSRRPPRGRPGQPGARRKARNASRPHPSFSTQLMPALR